MEARVEGAAEPRQGDILLRWTIGLRWALVALLALTLPLGERFFGFHVRYELAAPAIFAMALVNAVLARAGSRGETTTTRLVAIGVAADLVAVGVVLAASGGAANPLSAVFFVHVALAASLLPARTTFGIAALAAVVFAALFVSPSGACCPNHPANGAFSAHLYGMWMAFVLAAGLVAFFLTRVRGALEAREREIARLRQRAEENARFAALGTLAAGTAHELATPLGTIAVLAGEIADGADAKASAEVMASEVARCRDILARMQSGARRAASGTCVRTASLHAIAAWRRAHPEARVDVRADEAVVSRVALAEADLEAAIWAVLDNALFASRAAKTDEPIVVALEPELGAAVLSVADAGVGVPPELVGRLGEPFLTTKEPGEGMGLGLYLVRKLLASIGGALEIAPRAPRGTRVVLRLAEQPG